MTAHGNPRQGVSRRAVEVFTPHWGPSSAASSHSQHHRDGENSSPDTSDPRKRLLSQTDGKGEQRTEWTGKGCHGQVRDRMDCGGGTEDTVDAREEDHRGAVDPGQDPPHIALLTELPRWATSWQGPAGRPGHQPALPPGSVCLCSAAAGGS